MNRSTTSSLATLVASALLLALPGRPRAEATDTMATEPTTPVAAPQATESTATDRPAPAEAWPSDQAVDRAPVQASTPPPAALSEPPAGQPRAAEAGLPHTGAGLQLSLGVGSAWNWAGAYDLLDDNDVAALLQARAAYRVLALAPLALSVEAGYGWSPRGTARASTFGLYDASLDLQRLELGLLLGLEGAPIAWLLPYARLGLVEYRAAVALEDRGEGRRYAATGWAPGLYGALGLALGSLAEHRGALGWGLWVELRGEYASRFRLRLREELPEPDGDVELPDPIADTAVRLGGLAASGLQLVGGLAISY